MRELGKSSNGPSAHIFLSVIVNLVPLNTYLDRYLVLQRTMLEPAVALNTRVSLPKRQTSEFFIFEKAESS